MAHGLADSGAGLLLTEAHLAPLFDDYAGVVWHLEADGSIEPSIDRVFPMEGFPDACDYMRQPRTSHGKVVIETGI